ncbi:MAG: DNA ligase [Methanotrichaceae archaeon]|nr:DNA ligase [Methanotrichaceae archaeon]
MLRKDSLKAYRDMRNFSATPEPSDQLPDDQRIASGQIFVIQKHRSRSLHYDLRLEVDGILKSWAIPKGPSVNPKDRRLALPTEDHPLAYAQFEGVIPEGEYGAGAVIVWDVGTYENLTEKKGRPVSMKRALEMGHISFRLDGRRLKGGFALTRTGVGKEERWLLVKRADEEADPTRDPIAEHQDSVISGRTLDEIAGDAL